MKSVLTFFFLWLIAYQTFSQPLSLQWSKPFIGSNGGELRGGVIKYDANGNIYTAGHFVGVVDFDPGPSVYTLQTHYWSPYITKSDSSGNLIWARHFFNPGLFPHFCFITAIDVDAMGNVFGGGYFQEALDFDPGPLTYTLNPVNGSGYIFKLNTAGNLNWVVQVGDSASGSVNSLRLDATGNVIVGGSFLRNGNDFDPGPGTFILNSFGSSDIYILKLNSNGQFNWVQQIGSYGTDHIGCLDVNSNGLISYSGSFDSICDFDPGLGSTLLNAANGEIFVGILNSNGNYQNAWQIGPPVGNASIGRRIQFDPNNNIVLACAFKGIGDFDPGSLNSSFTCTAQGDIALTKFSITGSLLWAKQIKSQNFAGVFGLRIHSNGEIGIVGDVRGVTDFDPGPGTYTHSIVGVPAIDGYIAKYDANGNFIWHLPISGPDIDVVNDLVWIPNGRLLVIGIYTAPTDLDPGPSTYTLPSYYRDAFISKFAPCISAPTPTLSQTTLTSCGVSNFTLNALGNSISWRNNLNSNTYLAYGPQYNTGVLSTGTYSFYAASSNSCALSQTPALVQVSVFPIPTISVVSSKTFFCQEDEIVITASGASNYALLGQFFSSTLALTPLTGGIFTISGTDQNGCYGSSTFSLQSETCLGFTQQPTFDSAIQLWPNPSTGDIQINVPEKCQLHILNVVGQKVKSIYVNEGLQAIHLDLPNGSYFIRMVYQNKMHCMKLILID